METSTVSIILNTDSEWVFSMPGHVVKNRRANLKSFSVNDILFPIVFLKLRKKRLATWFHSLSARCFKSVFWIWNEPLNELPIAMWSTLHEFIMAFRHTVTGADSGGKQWEEGGCGLGGCAGLVQVRSLRAPRGGGQASHTHAGAGRV